MNLNPHIRPLWAISLEAAYAADMAAQERHQRQQSRDIQDGPRASHRPTRPGNTDEAMQARLERGDRKVAQEPDAAVVDVGDAWKIARQRSAGLDRWAPHGRHPQPSGDLPGDLHIPLGDGGEQLRSGGARPRGGPGAPASRHHGAGG